MAGRRWTSRAWGWAIGALATLVGVTIYLAGWLDRLDGYNLDLHFRHCNTLHADPRIVVIAIDDSTLQAMPDWPWPRRVFADLVRTIDEFGPKSIVLDFVFDLPSATSRSNDIQDTGDDDASLDDESLTNALADAGNVFLAMPAELRRCWEDRPRHSQLSEARAKVRAFLVNNPGGTLRDFQTQAAPQLLEPVVTPEKRIIVLAFAQESSLRKVMATSGSNSCYQGSGALCVVDPTPPLGSFVRAAAGVGLVSFHRHDLQSTVRSVPLYGAWNDRCLHSLGLLVAGKTIGVPPLHQVHWSDGLPSNEPGLDRKWISPGGEKEALVNWVVPLPDHDWRSTFSHLPAARVLEIVENRRAWQDNLDRLGISIAELVRLRHTDTPATYDRYAILVNRRIASARSDPYSTTNRTPLDDAEIAQIESEAIEWLQRAWSLWKDASPRNDGESAEKERIKKLYDRFGEGQYAAHIDATNKKLEARIAELSAELGPMLKDKIVLVGYTATAMADMVPTPVDPAMPGVLVHANVVNMFLQNRFASEFGPANSLLMLLAGAITTLASMCGRTRVSVAVLALLIVAAIGGGAATFYFSTVHVASFSIAACVLLTWGCVTVYRQATDERSRRKLQRALSQYTSPAVAARIAEQARGDTLAPQTARVTSFFSDLSGFTAMSERLGPQRTRETLDPYLREVSAVIMARGGMVNKFIGDGVFAFFNAPILPCANHAAAACESALAVASKLRDDPSLSIRVGLSTGDAFVGDYGSEQKLDYTCIGDTVNVGQRLERANKFFGTTILTDEATRRNAGDGFVFRPLGLIAVSGRSAPVAIHELVGRKGEVSPATLTAIDHFADAIRCFQTCQWDACMKNLDECLPTTPADRPTAKLRELVDRLRRSPQPSDWTGEINIADS